jgi:hypothetical protein
MAVFLNTTQALGEVENILTTAKTQIVLISPFVKINEELIARLVDAGTRRKIKVKLVCRENDLKPEEKAKIKHIDNLELFWVKSQNSHQNMREWWHGTDKEMPAMR